jgi:chromosome segregation ATPase
VAAVSSSELVKTRKIDGLLKLIQEKNQQIESLKMEISQEQQKQSMVNSNIENSSTELNSSLSSNSNLNVSMNGNLNTAQPANKKLPIAPKSSSSFSFQFSSNSNVIKSLVVSLEKEIEIYKSLNSPNKRK